MKYRKLPDIDLLKQHLEYHPETGIFIRKISGDLAGTFDKNGYRKIVVLGQQYYAHRLAFYMFYGKDPGHYRIDHINCDRGDNRIKNLRRVRASKNARNRRSKGHYEVDADGVGRWVTGCP